MNKFLTHVIFLSNPAYRLYYIKHENFLAIL
jgi:hypothetical protein